MTHGSGPLFAIAHSTAPRLTATTDVNEQLDEIAKASTDQTVGLEQISTGVAELDKVTQSNAASSEELAAAAEETASQTSTLRDLLGKFRVSEGAPDRSFDGPNRIRSPCDARAD